ncbi:MAG: hypothetical protein H9872_03735 [Candidatus Cellulosilyticum pullistercoris]|uniref:Yip1 domain-containing protein n=1 Tax=Candidatus Cellulosilyticum pullistercoris TaxID=2838521 RepID=A0A9E2KBP9_9FIRM|nr:hypothetical protein [Candidatus Cellulosilyticum pullistercoris]
MGVAFWGLFIGVFVVPIILLGIATFIMNRLLQKIDDDGDSFDTKTEEITGYESAIKLAIETIIHPSQVIEAGKITRYESEDYRRWLFGVAGMIGVIMPIITQGIRGILSGVLGVFTSLLGVWIGSWFFVGFRTLLFRYIGGINLDYQEGKQVFRIVFLSNYILTTIINLISSLVPNFLVIHLNAYVDQITSISLLGILAWIWIEVIYYFLLTKRYKLRSRESLLKLILMILASLGIVVVIGSMMFMIFLATVWVRI